jgi:hypothetical protein
VDRITETEEIYKQNKTNKQKKNRKAERSNKYLLEDLKDIFTKAAGKMKTRIMNKIQNTGKFPAS